MSLSELVSLGDKIDIRLIQQVEQSKITGETPKTFKSSTLDIISDTELEISMPTDGGKMVLLPVGVRFNFIFYCKSGMFECIGIVKDRYKKDNFFMLLIQAVSKLTKIQRCEYYRMQCILDMNYYKISEEMAQLDTTEEIFACIRNDEEYNVENKGAILDISGGGIRFVGKNQIEPNSYILLVIHLDNAKMDEQFYIVGQIVASERSVKDNDKYESRVKFVFKDPKVREEIIRYIFEEERRARKRENG